MPESIALRLSISIFCCSLFSGMWVLAASTPGSSVIVKSVMIIDGTGASPYGPVDVEILGNRISRIRPHLNSSASLTIPGAGKTLIPGLIDCHTHIRTVPGAAYRNENLSDIREQQKRQLQAYLAAGVTTVLDAAAPVPLFEEVAQIEKTTTIPRFLGLSPFLTPHTGYFASQESRGNLYADLSKPIEKLEDITQRIREAKIVSPLGMKVTVEYGFSPFAAFPVFDSTFIQKIRQDSLNFNLPIFVHTESEKAFRIALNLKPYAFMHGGFFDAPATPEIVREIKKSGGFVVSTLAIYKMMLLLWDQNLLEDPWVQLLVPKNQLETAKQKSSEVVKQLAVQNKPWFVPQFIARLLGEFFINPKSIHKNYLNSRVSISDMRSSGIPIVMGSDSGNYPLFTTFFHGVGSILEMESLIDAGFTPTEAIHAATLRAATMLKIDKEVGSISVGKIADLVLLNQDPTNSKNAFRQIDFVIKNGIAKKPADWLQEKSKSESKAK